MFVYWSRLPLIEIDAVCRCLVFCRVCPSLFDRVCFYVSCTCVCCVRFVLCSVVMSWLPCFDCWLWFVCLPVCCVCGSFVVLYLLMSGFGCRCLCAFCDVALCVLSPLSFLWSVVCCVFCVCVVA